MLTQPSSSFKLLVRASAAPPSLSFIRKSLSINFACAVLTMSRVMNTAMGTMSCNVRQNNLHPQPQPHTTPSTVPPPNPTQPLQPSPPTRKMRPTPSLHLQHQQRGERREEP